MSADMNGLRKEREMNRTHLTIFVVVVVILSLFGVYTHFTSDSFSERDYCAGWVDGYRTMAEYTFDEAPPADFNERAFAICIVMEPWES